MTLRMGRTGLPSPDTKFGDRHFSGLSGRMENRSDFG